MDRDKGQNEKPETKDLKLPETISFFAGSSYFVFIYKKTERLVTALYMVTSFLADSEPLKWRIRELAADFLSLANNLKDSYSTRKDDLVYKLHSVSLEVVSLLEIAEYAGLISPMNSKILREEMNLLLSNLSQPKEFGNSIKNLIIDKSFFDNEKEIENAVRQENSAVIKDKISSISTSQPREHKRQSSAEEPRTVSENALQKKEKRRKTIIELIKRKGNITIRDVSTIISDWSEKTIQRELLALVAAGVLKKEGERRWSRYSLARS